MESNDNTPTDAGRVALVTGANRGIWAKSNDGMRPAVTVMMQYGDATSWEEAKSSKEVSYDMPAHILRENLPGVLDAIGRLAEKHGFIT